MPRSTDDPTAQFVTQEEAIGAKAQAAQRGAAQQQGITDSELAGEESGLSKLAPFGYGR